jgi:hypothetical protein
MSAEEYTTVFVTDQGSVQQAVARTKIMDWGGRGVGNTGVHCFSQQSQDEVVTQPNKCPSKDKTIQCFHT